MAALKHSFNGEMMTVAEIKKIVSCESDWSIRQHLEAGRNTTSAMIQHNGKAGLCAAGRKGSRRSPWKRAMNPHVLGAQG